METWTRETREKSSVEKLRFLFVVTLRFLFTFPNHIHRFHIETKIKNAMDCNDGVEFSIAFVVDCLVAWTLRIALSSAKYVLQMFLHK